MQRWGSDQAPGGSVLLRTGLLTSLASLGTAGLVLCGALAVGGPSGTSFTTALGDGLSPVTVEGTGTPDEPTVLAAPADRPAAEPTRTRTTARPETRRRGAPAPAVVDLDGGALSGTTSSAAMTPEDADLDSVTHPARDQVAGAPALRETAPPPTVPADPTEATPAVEAPPVPAVPAGPATGTTEPPAPAVSRAPAPSPSAPQPSAVAPVRPAPTAGAPAVRRASTTATQVPAGKPARPAAKPAKPAQPVVEPAQQAAEPVRPAAKPAKPVAKPAKPVRPAAKPVAPAAKPAKPVKPATPAKAAPKPVAPTVQTPAEQPVQAEPSHGQGNGNDGGGGNNGGGDGGTGSADQGKGNGPKH